MLRWGEEWGKSLNADRTVATALELNLISLQGMKCIIYYDVYTLCMNKETDAIMDMYWKIRILSFHTFRVDLEWLISVIVHVSTKINNSERVQNYDEKLEEARKVISGFLLWYILLPLTVSGVTFWLYLLFFRPTISVKNTPLLLSSKF